ncbi:hypothetical protein FGB62_95g076 [Gracilaria domingensis]|nr:hypothetical protein FGB62_95g076 [Gracilaria domingensis]
MAFMYAVEEDVALLQAVLQIGAHLRIKTDQEINPIKHCISKHVMSEVVERYHAIKRKEGLKFPPRTNKGLSHRFRNLIYRYGIGSLEDTGTEEVSLLRVRLLSKIVGDREKRNDKKRQRNLGLNPGLCDEGLKERPEGTPKKRVCISLGNGKLENDKEQASDPCPDEFSLSKDVVPNHKPSDLVRTVPKVEVKKETELPRETLVKGIDEGKARCLQLIVKMLDQSEERRSRMEERSLAIEEMLLSTKEVDDKNKTQSNEDFRYGKLRLEYMRTMLAKRELELREKELEMRQKEKMWCLMEKMLG